MFDDQSFVRLRHEMVDKQIISRGISDQRVLDVFEKIPRHKFVPEEYQKSSYGDFPLPIGENQTISQPYIVALMTETLQLQNTDKVLEVGTGSGYQTAILASLSKEVYSIERVEILANNSFELLKSLGFKNIALRIGDGTLGLEEFAPYDKICVTAASPYLADALAKQLSSQGKIVIPIEAGIGQVLTLFTKEEGELKRKEICGCTFVPLIGKHGYKQ
jgi:protein-L-isoaspartate(D-aspartate) O-methyltransferase